LSTVDCQLGACDTRRCTGDVHRTCAADAECNVGPCTNRRCPASATFRRCATNADCDLGTCPAQLTCRNLGLGVRDCWVDGDCNHGDCTVGEASIAMGGPIYGSSMFPAKITLRAANSVAITAPIDLSGTAFDSDGGDLTVVAEAGDVSLAGKIRARSGGQGQGGALEADAGRDIEVTGPVDVSG